jgi:hypothetical protein
MYREIRNECLGSGPTTASSYERHILGFVRCYSCGRTFKVRNPNKEEVTIPRHSRPVEERKERI